MRLAAAVVVWGRLSLASHKGVACRFPKMSSSQGGRWLVYGGVLGRVICHQHLYSCVSTQPASKKKNQSFLWYVEGWGWGWGGGAFGDMVPFQKIEVFSVW